jgi:membrane protein
MILAVAFLLLVSLAASAAFDAASAWSSGLFGGWEPLVHGINFVVSFVLTTVMFALIYRYMPQARITWHDVVLGAVVTALLFTIGKFAIGLYIGKSALASGFGAAGSLAVLLAWVYYSAQIFLFGAEFTWAWAHAVGSRKGEQQAVPDESRHGRPDASLRRETARG